MRIIEELLLPEVVKANVVEVSFLDNTADEVLTVNPMDLVLIVSSTFAVVPEQALHFRNDGAKCCEERSDHHFVTIPSVNWFASFSEDEKVLPD